jgi:hypothetical protein
MGPFRDCRQVIQTGARCCGASLCAATRTEPTLLRQVFRKIVARSRGPAEMHRLRKAAASALL